VPPERVVPISVAPGPGTSPDHCGSAPSGGPVKWYIAGRRKITCDLTLDAATFTRTGHTTR